MGSISANGLQKFWEKQYFSFGDGKMSAMSELQPQFDEYLGKMRRAKNSKGYTLQDLADLTGVPYNNICEANSGRAKQPLLFYEAAKCKVLELSLDDLCGLRGSEDVARLADKVRDLEIENTRLTGDVRRLTEIGTEKDKRIYSHRPMLYALVGICVILALSLVGYMIFDATITTAGLFKSAGTSVFAIVLMLVILLALVVVFLAVRSDLEWNK